MNVRRSIQILATKTPVPLRRFMKRTFVPGSFLSWLYPDGVAKALEKKLWGGFSRYALKDLETLKRSRCASQKEVSYAAWALARWHSGEREYVRAYENVVLMQIADRSKRTDMGQVLLEADCLIRLGDREAARAVLEDMLQQRPDDPSLCLAMANTYAPIEGSGDAESDAIRLAWINRIYKKANLCTIAKSDPAAPLTLNNLTGSLACTRAPYGNEPKVTVIMPVYKAEATLPFALRSVLEQSWQNLEVIVVDDCSPDHSFAIAEAFAKHDARVRAVRQDKNQGAYVARNKGLELATGEFVTVHDGDDWSHPQKIESQLAALRNQPGSSVTMTYWVRTLPQLYFDFHRIMPALIVLGYSSLCVSRQLAQTLGGWDEVRVSSDAEFIRRVNRFGTTTEHVLKNIPMAFASNDAVSLTGRPATHLRTLRHGVRRHYLEAAQHWHQTVEGVERLRLSPRNSHPFPAPGVDAP